MTAKDYELIADVLRQVKKHKPVDPTYAEGFNAAISAISIRLAFALEQDNTNFNYDQFITACFVG